MRYKKIQQNLRISQQWQGELCDTEPAEEVAPPRRIYRRSAAVSAALCRVVAAIFFINLSFSPAPVFKNENL